MLIALRHPIAFVRTLRAMRAGDRARANARLTPGDRHVPTGVITANPSLGPRYGRTYRSAAVTTAPEGIDRYATNHPRRAVALIPTERVDAIVNTLDARVGDVIDTLLPLDTYALSAARYLPEPDAFEVLVSADYLLPSDPAAVLPRYTLDELTAMQEATP